MSGDDVRTIDWKMYAKTEKFYIKQTSIQTEHQYVFILDNSKSMEYEEGGWSKLMFGKILLAAMMRVLANQGDHFAWRSRSANFPMGSGMRHWQHGLETLYLLKSTDVAKFIEPIEKQSTTFVWVSDFYHSSSDIQKYAQKLKNPKTDLIMFHLLGEAEKNLNFGANTTFVDLENGERMDVNAKRTREEYKAKLQAHSSKLRNIGFETGAHYEEILINRPIADTLRRFFHHYQYSAV